MTKQLARTQHVEDGFTLIEMIVAVVITTMILGALAAVFVTSSRSTSATSHRSNQASDAQVISSFLVKDAQAAGGVNPQTGLNDTDLGVFAERAKRCLYERGKRHLGDRPPVPVGRPDRRVQLLRRGVLAVRQPLDPHAVHDADKRRQHSDERRDAGDDDSSG